MSKWTRVLIGLELQVPFHSMPIFNAFLDFIANYQPDKLIGIGDHLDCPAPARWNRGTAEEYAGKLQKEVDLCKKLFWEVRRKYDGPWESHEGNHERRIEVYARTKAPAFNSLECLTVRSLLDYDLLGISELQAVAPLCPGFVTTHDFGGKLRISSQYAGGTAIAGARRIGKSVVMGHTHKLGHIQQTIGGRLLHGVETGHQMDEKRAGYVSYPNWQAGWAVVEFNGTAVGVSLVNVDRNGRVHYRDA